jgi:8-oxo-dGTP diphosphatase
MENENVSVVEAIIKNSKGEILLLKRSKKNKHYVGKWQLPGGKVEFGEKINLAIKRELFEEVGIKFKKVNLSKVFSLESNFKNNSVKTIFLMVFETNFFGKIKLGEDHTKFKFVSLNKINKKSLTLISKKSIFG